MNALRDIVRTEIHSTAHEIRALKRWWRTPPEQRPARPATQFAIGPSKQRATLLCMVMAHSRGRVHLSLLTLDAQETRLREALDVMDRMTVQTPLLDVPLREAVRAILVRRMLIAPITACVAPTEEHRA